MICTVSIAFVTCMHVTVVLDKQIYLYYKPHNCHFRTPLIINIWFKFYCDL